jgi:hypothetical protein
MVAGNLFSIAFGNNLDAHDGVKTTAASAPQCSEGLNCYVATIYLTAGATFLSVLLSVWAGYRDRRKINAARRRQVSRRTGDTSWDRDDERTMINA